MPARAGPCVPWRSNFAECRLHMAARSWPGRNDPQAHPARQSARWLARGRLEHPDALAADNLAACEVPERPRRRITLISPGGRAVETAFASLSAVDWPAQACSLAAPQRDLLVWDGLVPDRLPPGPNLVLAPERNCDLWTLGPVATGPATVNDEIDSPAVSQVDFTETVLEDPIRLEFRLPAHVLVRSSAGDRFTAGWPARMATSGLAGANRQDRSGGPWLAANPAGRRAGARSASIRRAMSPR